MRIKLILNTLRLKIHDVAALFTIMPIVLSVISNFIGAPEIKTLIMYVSSDVLSTVQLINL